MGKAYKAPDSIYRRQLVISAHAIQRFRERVEKHHQARSDGDLGNLLDERIRVATNVVNVFDTRNPDAATRVVEIENQEGGTYYAILRDQTVVTVLDRRMMEGNFENGSWKREALNNKAFAKLSAMRVGPTEPVIPGVERSVREQATERTPLADVVAITNHPQDLAEVRAAEEMAEGPATGAEILALYAATPDPEPDQAPTAAQLGMQLAGAMVALERAQIRQRELAQALADLVGEIEGHKETVEETKAALLEAAVNEATKGPSK